MEWEEWVPVIYTPSLAKPAQQGLADQLHRAEEKVRALIPASGRSKQQWTESDYYL
jgi:hypothetical protein